jgi:hypothetical protein
MLVPVLKGKMSVVKVWLDADRPAKVEVQLRVASREGNFTPDVILSRKRLSVPKGRGQQVAVDFGVDIPRAQYVFICLMPCPGVSIRLSDNRVTGILSLVHGANRNVAKSAVQKPPAGIGVDTFEFWIPERRPGGKNFAIAFDPPLAGFGPENIRNGISRPTTGPNAWVTDVNDPVPALTITWNKPQKIRRIELSFDTDFDHALESVQWGHPEATVPFCIKRYTICDSAGRVIATCEDNHQTHTVICLPKAVVTDRLVLKDLKTHGKVPPALFDVRCYA